MPENIGIFIIDKLSGALIPTLKRKIVVTPRTKIVQTSSQAGSVYRYFLFIINQKTRPFYNLNLRLSADAENVPAQIDVTPVLDGQEYQPTHPIAAGSSTNQPIVDIGFMGMAYADRKHFSFNLRIDHINPNETKKLEVVISRLPTDRRFEVKHEISFSNDPVPLEITRGAKPGKISVSMQGLNWKFKR